MKDKKQASKKLMVLPLILGISSFCTFALYYYSANHAPYSYIDIIMCRTDTLLYWRDCFHCYEEKQKTVSHVMDKRTYCLFIKPYNLCSDYYIIDSNYGGGV